MTQKQGGFSLNQLAKPLAELATGQGTIYIYAPTGTVLKLHRELETESAEERARRTLAQVTSQVVRDSWRATVVPLPEEVMSSLDESEVSRLVELFWRDGERARANSRAPHLQVQHRQEDETSLTFFDRVMDAYAKLEHEIAP